MSQPLHQHDCDTCVYLGTLYESDLYYHDGGDRPSQTTVIARHSSNGPDYTSGLGFAQPYVDAAGTQQPGIPLLVAARHRAIERGLLWTR